MKNEQLVILEILQKGEIDVEEAERLLSALNTIKSEREKNPSLSGEKIVDNLNSMMSKVGDVIETFVRTVNDNANKATPAVKKAVEAVKPVVSKTSEAVKPVVAKTVSNIKEKIDNKNAIQSDIIDDVEFTEINENSEYEVQLDLQDELLKEVKEKEVKEKEVKEKEVKEKEAKEKEAKEKEAKEKEAKLQRLQLESQKQQQMIDEKERLIAQKQEELNKLEKMQEEIAKKEVSLKEYIPVKENLANKEEVVTKEEAATKEKVVAKEKIDLKEIIAPKEEVVTKEKVTPKEEAITKEEVSKEEPLKTKIFKPISKTVNDIKNSDKVNETINKVTDTVSDIKKSEKINETINKVVDTVTDIKNSEKLGKLFNKVNETVQDIKNSEKVNTVIDKVVKTTSDVKKNLKEIYDDFDNKPSTEEEYDENLDENPINEDDISKFLEPVILEDDFDYDDDDEEEDDILLSVAPRDSIFENFFTPEADEEVFNIHEDETVRPIDAGDEFLEVSPIFGNPVPNEDAYEVVENIVEEPVEDATPLFEQTSNYFDEETILPQTITIKDIETPIDKEAENAIENAIQDAIINPEIEKTKETKTIFMDKENITENEEKVINPTENLDITSLAEKLLEESDLNAENIDIVLDSIVDAAVESLDLKAKFDESVDFEKIEEDIIVSTKDLDVTTLAEELLKENDLDVEDIDSVLNSVLDAAVLNIESGSNKGTINLEDIIKPVEKAVKEPTNATSSMQIVLPTANEEDVKEDNDQFDDFLDLLNEVKDWWKEEEDINLDNE